MEDWNKILGREISFNEKSQLLTVYDQAECDYDAEQFGKIWNGLSKDAKIMMVRVVENMTDDMAEMQNQIDNLENELK